jgi:preprotein translocase subunit SecY
MKQALSIFLVCLLNSSFEVYAFANSNQEINKLESTKNVLVEENTNNVNHQKSNSNKTVTIQYVDKENTKDGFQLSDYLAISALLFSLFTYFHTSFKNRQDEIARQIKSINDDFWMRTVIIPTFIDGNPPAN